VVGILIGAYLLVVGVLAGVAMDRMLWDRERSDVLDRYDQALREWKTYRIALEKSAEGQR
jgi:hypothetical protein